MRWSRMRCARRPASRTGTWAGFVYVAFVIDCYSRAIVGWHAATTKTTPLVTTALRMALWRRDHHGHPVGAGLIHQKTAMRQSIYVNSFR